MKILLLIHEYPPVGGGGGRIAETIAGTLAGLGHEICIITDDHDEIPPDPEKENIELIRLNSLRKEPFRATFLNMGLYIIKGLFAGLAQIRKNRPDVIHVHFAVPAGALAFLLSLFTGVPYVLTAHLGDIPGGSPQKTGKWFKFVLPFTPPIWRKAAAATTVSSFSRGLAEAHYDVPIEIIPNCVEMAPDDGVITAGSPVQIVFAGRFVPQKNLLFLVNALAEVNSHDWHCTLIGDGPLRSEIEHRITEVGLQKNITITGWIEPDQVEEIFRKSDIFVLPSLWEGMPVVGLQALAAGLAVLSTDVGGMEDMIHESENGHILPYDTAAWADSLETLMGNPDRLLSYKAFSKDISTEFSAEKIGKRYEDTLKKAAGLHSE